LSDGRSIGDVGEHSFLERLCARLSARAAASGSSAAHRVLVGPGDDCAVVGPSAEPLALTTDTVVEEVHFRRGWLSPAEIGERVVTVNLSDLAAMAATPRFCLAAVAIPSDRPARDLDELLDACAGWCEAAGAVLVGGNVTRADRLSVTVTAIGAVEGRWLARSGARPGDRIVVTGTLGGAAAAVASWLAGAEPPAALRERFARPVARLAAGRALAAAGARAAVDVSDGLLADLGHLCTASGVGALVARARLPRLPEVARLDASGQDFAATGGEDYELVAALPPEVAADLARLAGECGVELTDVGECTAAAGVVMLDEAGRDVTPARGGFDHFAGRSAAGASRSETR
jgi:thiamine-monophosphate kinase